MADYSNNRAPRYHIPRGNPQPAPRPQAEPRQPSSDPLSELARLIGQTDPFADTPQPPRSERSPLPRSDGWPGQPAAPSYSTGLPPLMPEFRQEPPRQPQHRHEPPPSYDPYAAQQAYEQQQYEQQHYQQPAYGAPPPLPPQQHYGVPPAQYGAAPAQYGRADAPYYGDDGQLVADDPYAQHYGYEERRPRRRGGLVTVIALVAFAVLGTAGAYAYRTMFSGAASGPPPLIKADTTPAKIVPAQNSADNSANKQIYDRVGGTAGQGEKVVSREEQPVDIRPNDTRSAYAGNSGQQTIAGVLAAQPPGGFPGASAQPSSASGQGDVRKVRTVTIKPDAPGAAQARSAPAAAPEQASPAPAPRAQRTANAPAGNAPLSLTPGASASASTGTTASTARPPGGGFMVQISAQKSQAEATAAFKSAQAKHSDLLGTYQVVLRKKEIPGKGTFYGAQVGPFASREDATGLCSHLKSAGGNCLVEKN